MFRLGVAPAERKTSRPSWTTVALCQRLQAYKLANCGDEMCEMSEKISFRGARAPPPSTSAGHFLTHTRTSRSPGRPKSHLREGFAQAALIHHHHQRASWPASRVVELLAARLSANVCLLPIGRPAGKQTGRQARGFVLSLALGAIGPLNFSHVERPPAGASVAESGPTRSWQQVVLVAREMSRQLGGARPRDAKRHLCSPVRCDGQRTRKRVKSNDPT